MEGSYREKPDCAAGRNMIFIIEFDGPIIDIQPVYCRLHREIAEEVGWSWLDERTFWRLTRTKGRVANVLPEARPSKLKEYHVRFNERLESDFWIERYRPQAGIDEVLGNLVQRGTCCLITLGVNLAARRRVLERAGLTRYFTRSQTLNSDPRRRTIELQTLASTEQRTVVVASTDSVIRAADRGGLFTAGIASGPCTSTRLHQAGVRVVYPDIQGFMDSLSSGASDMIRAGLMPPPFE